MDVRRLKTMHLWLTELAIVLALLVVQAVHSPDTFAADTLTIRGDSNVGADTRASPAEVRLMNRRIVLLRADLAGVTPEVRASRTGVRFDALTPADLSLPVTATPGELGSQHGVAIYVGDKLLLALVEADRDPETRLTMDVFVQETIAKVKGALAARRDQQHWPTLIRGALLTAATLVGLLFLLWGLSKVRRLIETAVQASRQQVRAATIGRFDWALTFHQLTDRIVQIVSIGLGALLVFIWLEFSLLQFPLTQPLGARMGTYLWQILGKIGDAVVEAIPGLVVVAVILFITRGVHIVVSSIFTATARGLVRFPGLHPETAPATRRLATIVVWALGLTFAYPYIPGSDSEIFKGISVLLGFMLTLGSANVVNQMMSGMVLVYARALRVGDMVSIGDSIGRVAELGTLSVRLINLRQEEVTLPNAVVVASTVHNFSRSGDRRPDRAALLSSTVTIGYDTPWRQVHAMLLAAVEGVPDVTREPAPFVLQRGLSDFYVEYEVFFSITDASQRFFALSTLHGAIQDEFNRHGVQIMSPHFVLQPKEPVLVSPESWEGTSAMPIEGSQSDTGR